MIITVFFLTVLFLTIPDQAFAWGPLTHIYLGSEIVSLSAALPAAISALIRRYREDFLYGNLMADTILGKKFLPDFLNSHSWDVGLDLMESAETDQEKAFVYGYLAHLAADTVAHGRLTEGQRYPGHTISELKSDSLVGRRYWLMAMTISRRVQRRNDRFLEKTLQSPFFSVRTSRNLYKGIVYLSFFTPQRMNTFLDRTPHLAGIPSSERILRLHKKSIERMADILEKGECSRVLRYDPISQSNHGKVTSLLRELNEGRSWKR
jgi:hypothetical protein